MVNLKSVSNPSLRGLEAAVGEAPAKTRAGRAGSVGSAESLSAELLLVKGKGAPIAPPAPSGPRSILESIIGNDDRTRILDTEADPWRRICALRISSPTGVSVGTGWFVGPRTVMTAGHCVHHPQMNGWATSIEISPARNGTRQPRVLDSTRFSTVDRWADRQDPDFDLAAIHLNEAVGDELGWFGLASMSARDLTGYMVNISGYPADRGNGSEQWFHRNRVLRVSDRRVFYDVDTFGGHSGAPVFLYEDGDAEPRVVAIHAYGIGGTPTNFGITANSGVRVIPEVFDQIMAWVEGDTP